MSCGQDARAPRLKMRLHFCSDRLHCLGAEDRLDHLAAFEDEQSQNLHDPEAPGDIGIIGHVHLHHFELTGHLLRERVHTGRDDPAAGSVRSVEVDQDRKG